MRTRAIVIGIDQYTKPEWSLTGAVRDAVRFAHWAVHEGGVAQEDLTLLLAPLKDDPPLADPDLAALAALGQPATRKAIAKTWHAYQTGTGKDADRLFFYYAGHGLAPPGSAPDAGPLIVPADVDDLDFYVNFEPLGLETFRGAMQNVAPKQQFFFIDACRDVLPITGNRILTQQLLWDLRGIDDDSTQAVFLSTTAGQKAKEIRGEGLFGRALIAALRGLGPDLLPPAAPPAPGQRVRRRLLFDQLVKFVIEAVRRGLEELPEADASARKGIPYARVGRLTGEIPIAEFEPASIPMASISAIVDPEEARAIAGITFYRWDEETESWVVRTSNPAPLAPPLPEVATFKMRGGTHFLRVEAKGYETVDRNILVYEDKRFPIELEPQAVLLGGGLSPREAGGGLESISPANVAFEAEVVATTGAISLSCPDRLARLAVYDGGGRERIRGYESVHLDGLVPGPYKVTAELVASDRVEQTVTVRAGETQTVQLDVASPRLSPTVAAVLNDNQISVTNGYAYPSENFGPVANMGLASLLAYAAWGARFPEWMGFHHVRTIGIDPLAGLDPHGSALQVLLADARGNAADMSQCRVAVEASGALLLADDAAARTDVALTPLATLPMAVQGSAVLVPGTARVHVQVPAFAPASFAIALLPGFVSVLIIAGEDDGDIDVRQHLNPIDPTVPVAPDFEPPRADDVRLVDLASRALENRDPLDSIEFRGLLDGKRSNPMLGVIAGYRMLHTPREEQFRGTPAESPLANMLRLFDGLPDVHVLAGLYDPASRDDHFHRAAERGTPVLAEGFWALVQWLTATAMRENQPPPALRESVLPGIVWTAFSEPSPAARAGALRIVTPAGQTRFGDSASGDVLANAARAVGRLELESGVISSVALIEPRIVICPWYVAAELGHENDDGTWSTPAPARVQFEPGIVREVTRIVRTLRPAAGSTVDGGALDEDTLNRSWPVLLELAEDAPFPALARTPAILEAGDAVAVIGFPHNDARMPPGTFSQHFAGSSGEKHVMSGVILRAPDGTSTLDYDCFTAAGTSGGPVIELATGAIVAMHVAALPTAVGRKRGVGVVLDGLQ